MLGKDGGALAMSAMAEAAMVWTTADEHRGTMLVVDSSALGGMMHSRAWRKRPWRHNSGTTKMGRSGWEARGPSGAPRQHQQ